METPVTPPPPKKAGANSVEEIYRSLKWSGRTSIVPPRRLEDLSIRLVFPDDKAVRTTNQGALQTAGV